MVAKCLASRDRWLRRLSGWLRRLGILRTRCVENGPRASLQNVVTNGTQGRNRSEGWQWAKLSGHLNEELLVELLSNDKSFGRSIGIRIFGRDVGAPQEVRGGGSSAERVNDIFGHRTNGKPDIYLRWDGEDPVNLSVKKSLGGQVFLTSVDRFVKGFEFHFNESIPKPVVEMLHLFIGTDESRCDLVMAGRKYLGPKNRSGELQEIHQHRLLAITLSHHFGSDWNATLNWASENAGKIADFAFARGYAKSNFDFATHVWYFVSDSVGVDVDCLIPVEKIVMYSANEKRKVTVGPRNGGSTILFPFGFLQMHSPQGENQVQFHHSHAKIAHLGR